MTGNVDTDQPTARCPFSNPRELFADLADARRTEGLTFSETLNSYVVSRYDEIVEAVGRSRGLLLHGDDPGSTTVHP